MIRAPQYILENGKTELLNILSKSRQFSDVKPILNNLDFEDILVLYINWRSKMIYPSVRNLFLSNELKKNQKYISDKENFDAFLHKIETGIDVNQHLSKRIDIIVDPKYKIISKMRHLDILLNCWGIHHFHPSNILENGFSKRGNDLLFIAFRKNSAYVLDIGDHEDFNNINLLKIAATEFPNENIVSELKSASGLARYPSDKEYECLMKSGINSAYSFNGKIYSPTSGITSSGISVLTSMKADKIIINLEKFFGIWSTDKKIILGEVQRQKGYISRNTFFSIKEKDFKLIVFDNITGAEFYL